MIVETNLYFRAAELADIPALSEIRLAVRENRLSDPRRITPQMYEDYLARLGKGWLCEVGGRPVGFAVAARDASIWALFVYPEYEGRGIGKALLRLATAWLFSIGCERVRLSTAADTRADRFYAAQGWQRGAMKDSIEVCYELSANPQANSADPPPA